MVRRYLHKMIPLFAVLCLIVIGAKAAGEEPPFSAEVSVPGMGSVMIPLQQTNDGDYLFLPSFASLDNLVFRFPKDYAVLTGKKGALEIENGVPFSLRPLLEGDEKRCTLNIAIGEVQVSFTLMHSSAVRTAFLASGNEKQDRAYVEADKERKAKGVSFALLRPDGSAIWAGALKNIKGRGNSTWHYPKKPYQIKLSEQADLLETGDVKEKEATWILLANYVDESLLRNQITFDLAADFKLPFIPHCASVDLFYDGEYRGVYLLCEKTEISKGRVSIRDMEKAIEEANPGIKDYAELTAAEGSMDSGLIYRYYPDLKAPKDIRGGYLLELDYGPRAREEASWFCTENQQYVTVKSPEYVPEEGMLYIASLYQQFERAVFAGGTDPKTGKDYRSLCDLNSLAKCFLLMELAKDNDAFFSSTYFYKPEDKDKLYAGPVWDFDTGYGIADLPEDISVCCRTFLGSALLRIPSFREALCSVWRELEPLVRNVLLGAETGFAGNRLRNLTFYEKEIAAAKQMDRILWGQDDPEHLRVDIQTFLNHRADWLDKQLDAWYSGEVPEHLFLDVNENQWFYDAVEYTVEHGLFTGTSAIQFEPLRSIDRAMAISVIHRMLGAPESEKNCGYADVDPASWYASAVNWATEAGITGGIGKNRFAPGNSVSREQLITMLYRAVDYSGKAEKRKADLSSFSDVGQISAWALEAMAWAVDTGILQGNAGQLDPQGTTTRAQAAAIISRAYHSFFEP